MAGLIRRLAQVACKVEGTEGTPETLANTNAGFLVYEPKFTVDPKNYRRAPARASMSNLPRTIGGAHVCKLNFKTDLRGSGVAGTVPDWGILMKACGFSETISAGASVTYKPASTFSAYTMALYMNGICKKMTGARGTCKLVHAIGRPVAIEFEFWGIHVSITDLAMLASVSESNIVPAKFQGAQLTIATYAAILTELELDIGNKLAIREDANASDGGVSALITEREPVGSFDPEMDLVANHDFIGKLIAGTTMAFSEVIGSVAGNIATITMPSVQYLSVGDDDRNGLAVAKTGFCINQNTGDDELSIVLT